MALPALPSLFGVAMCLLGAVICLVSACHGWRTATFLRAAAADRIDGVADGTLVRVSGTVRAAERTLTAPFSAVDCVARRAVVEERRPGSVLLPTYVTVRDGRLDPFVVSTATPASTLVRLSRTSLAGVSIGVVAVALGVGLLVAG